jgi:hypothetical protein
MRDNPDLIYSDWTPVAVGDLFCRVGFNPQDADRLLYALVLGWWCTPSGVKVGAYVLHPENGRVQWSYFRSCILVARH